MLSAENLTYYIKNQNATLFKNTLYCCRLIIPVDYIKIEQTLKTGKFYKTLCLLLETFYTIQF